MKTPRILIAALMLISSQAMAEMVVVVSEKAPVKSLSSRDIASIFLSKTKYFPDGSRAVPMELEEDRLKSDFYQFLAGKTPAEVNAYWATLVFTGKGKPPRGFDDKDEYLRQLEDLPGAIGYLPEEEVPSTMRIVHVLP